MNYFMIKQKIQLNNGGQHYLQLSNSSESKLIELCYSITDLRSILHEAFKDNLLILIDGVKFTFPSESDYFTLPENATTVVIFLGSAQSIKIATCLLLDDGIELNQSYKLSPFETRFLAQNGYPHPVENLIENFSSNLSTDLHTHFAGCVTAIDLIRIGIENNLSYPGNLLQKPH